MGTVPWPTSPEKNSKVSPKFVDFSSYTNFRPSKKIEWMRPGPPYDTAKGDRRWLSPRDFKSKKLEIPLAPMLNRKSLERSRLQSTPPHSACSESVGGPSRAARGRQPQSRRAHGDGRKSLLRPLDDVAAATKRCTTSRLIVCGTQLGISHRFPHPSNYFR